MMIEVVCWCTILFRIAILLHQNFPEAVVLKKEISD
ncbi:hypothetical protein BFJ69_g6840 [Fusarium oxysporum]|uniref:Uncharacterized protein n=1 Tax=Fusarium oxysporum TaxID=5507 RepID=A0A420N8K8_FUSOX|nr:hypothetical protein BFJ69_g6840 [Fusarium oxysporum]